MTGFGGAVGRGRRGRVLPSRCGGCYGGLKRGRMQVLLSAGERQSAELMQKVRQHCQALHIASEFVGNNFFANTSFRQLEVRGPVPLIGGLRTILWRRGRRSPLAGGQWWLDVASTPRGAGLHIRLLGRRRVGSLRLEVIFSD